MLMGRPEDSRVKIPALVHFTWRTWEDKFLFPALVHVCLWQIQAGSMLLKNV